MAASRLSLWMAAVISYLKSVRSWHLHLPSPQLSHDGSQQALSRRMLDKLVSELESRFLHYQVRHTKISGATQNWLFWLFSLRVLYCHVCWKVQINLLFYFINCLQAVNESRIRLAVYRAVDAALDDYSKTVEDVSCFLIWCTFIVFYLM